MEKITKENLMENIVELEKLGFKRWTKNGMDRMYINARELGLTCTYYKTGNISSAMFGDEDISNSEGYRLKAAKTYIDLKQARIVSDSARLAEKVAEIIGAEHEGTRTQYTIA